MQYDLCSEFFSVKFYFLCATWKRNEKVTASENVSVWLKKSFHTIQMFWIQTWLQFAKVNFCVSEVTSDRLQSFFQHPKWKSRISDFSEHECDISHYMF